MNVFSKSLSLLILAISLFWATVCFSQQPPPEEVFRQYRMTLSTSDDFDSLTGLLSSRSIESSRQYIDKMKSRGLSEEDAKTALFRGRKQIFEYEKNRKQIDFRQTGNKAVISFEVEEENIPNHFKKSPSADTVETIEKTIEEVHFVYENGWKLDRISIKPKRAR
jgi:hypothetical protein